MGEPFDLDAIQARADAATPGRWDPDIVPVEHGERHRVTQYAGSGAFFDINVRSEADAEFIAHAREDVPALVAALRETRALAFAAAVVRNTPAFESAADELLQAVLLRLTGDKA